MSLRRILSLLCLAASAAALAGCGGDTLSFDPVASAATKTAQSESSRVAITATMDVDGLGGMAFSGAGVFDGSTRSGALNMRFQLPQDAQAQLGAVDPTMQMIMDGRRGFVVYMRSPLFVGAGDIEQIYGGSSKPALPLGGGSFMTARAPLAPGDIATFYSGAAEGYTDYPRLDEAAAA